MSAFTCLPLGVTVFERGWLSSNNILFQGRHETALVDSGYATHAEQTLALVMGALGERPLDRLLNTHLHSDHCGGNAALQRRFPNVQTRIPPGEATAVRLWDESALSYAATGQQCPRFRFEALLTSGEQVGLGDSLWEVHSAPGHDSHSVILFEPESRVLISADALWEKGFGVIFPELAGESSFAEVAATLELIERLGPREVVPGHGRVFTDVSGALTNARTRLDTFSKDPQKHARYALKVLVKFKLLECEHLSLPALTTWTEATPYFETVRRRFFSSQSTEALLDETVSGLIRRNAAAITNGHLLNRP